MWYVYVIKSTVKAFTYIGSTNNIKRRLQEHNEDECNSSKHYEPFELEAYVAVKNEAKAKD